MNGNVFTPGKPSNIVNYTAIAFKGTSDIIYVPNSVVGEMTQSFILKYKNTIQKICPGINFDIQ